MPHERGAQPAADLRGVFLYVHGFILSHESHPKMSSLDLAALEKVKTIRDECKKSIADWAEMYPRLSERFFKDFIQDCVDFDLLDSEGYRKMCDFLMNLLEKQQPRWKRAIYAQAETVATIGKICLAGGAYSCFDAAKSFHYKKDIDINADYRFGEEIKFSLIPLFLGSIFQIPKCCKSRKKVLYKKV